MERLNPLKVKSPCFLIDKGALMKNLAVLVDIRDRCGVKVLLAQKAFASPSLYPIISDRLDGVCASGLHEARLGRENFGKLVHTCGPAYREDEIREIMEYSDHLVFNSLGQLELYGEAARSRTNPQIGLRVNPEKSVTEPAIYDPSAPGSRLGVRADELSELDPSGLDGLHFHALCERDSHALEVVLGAFESKFDNFLDHVKWVNMGGGHAFTRGDYDTDHFVGLVNGFKARHPNLEVFVEPGSAVLWDAGVLVSTVLDIVHNQVDIAILDISCSCHTPDILEMPYRARIWGEVPMDAAPHRYRLGGVSCLAGDVFGDYGFDRELKPGDQVVFKDMAHYTFVKTTMFNGVRHPSIATFDPATGVYEVVREFTYEDYRGRMG